VIVEKGKYIEGIGRRKTSTARVRIFQGDNAHVVNEKPIEDYFGENYDAPQLLKPFRATDFDGKLYFTAKVSGGGIISQQYAIQLGIARALIKMDPELKKTLRDADVVTRDPRMVERKKVNFRKARKKPQFSKR
jgi:small subunit ribosomal protein S9